MKTRNALIIAAFFAMGFIACKKDGNTVDSKSLISKWSVARDTDYTGVGAGNQMVVYVGKAGDYFDFRTDGHVYTKEGAVLDTLTYSLQADNKVVISKFGITLNGTPTVSTYTVSAHSASIVTPRILTPGGQFGRVVSLAR